MDNCTPDCRKSDKQSFNNNYVNYVFCKKCSMLFRKDIKAHKNKVLSFEKFNRNFDEVINTDYYKDQVKENKSIIKKIIKITKKKPENILDYGCGYGAFMFAAKDLNLNVSGYDINENFTNNLIKYFETFKSNEDLLCQNNRKKYDLIFCRKVLTLSSNIYEDFQNFDKLLNQNGYLIIMDQVKNFSKYKSMLSLNNNNNTLLLTIQTLKYFANNFYMNVSFLNNDFGDVLIIFKKSERKNLTPNISINSLKVFEKFSFIFFSLFKLKNIFKKIYYYFRHQ